MPQKISSGLLMYRISDSKVEFLLTHPGGPFFAKKDDGFWSIPKGEPNEGEDLLETAKREFEEEIGFKPHSKEFVLLGQIKQKNGRIVHCWAFSGEFREFKTKSFFDLEWPPYSGRFQKFPEVDRAEWMDVQKAKVKIHQEQFELIERFLKSKENNINNE